MKLVFMGTPEFASVCLDALCAAGHEVCAVFTQPDKPKGRGYALTPPPVKENALARGIPVHQPATLRDGEALRLIGAYAPQAVVVAAYGKILPKELLELPPLGCVNVHASLLPKYRGAAPIQWAVVNGETESGVTTMLMAEGLDTGDMLERERLPIGPEETAGELHDRLAACGARLIVSTLARLEAGTLAPTPQDDASASYAPILKKEMGRLDFSRSARRLHDLVRGFSPWPSAFTALNGKRMKVFSSRLAGAGQGSPGSVETAGGRLLVTCGDGAALELCEVQLEGGRRMAAEELLRGRPIAAGTVLGE